MIADKSFFQIFKTSPLPAAILSPERSDCFVLGCNDAFLSKFEVSDFNNSGSKLSDILRTSKFEFSDDFYAQLKKIISRVIKVKKPDSFGYTCLKCLEVQGNGLSQLYWTIELVPIIDELNKVSDIVLYLHLNSYTEESDYKFLINNMEESFVFVDRNLKVVSFNNQFRALYNICFKTDVNVGDYVIERVRPDRKVHIQEIFKSVFSGQVAESETEFISSNNSVVTLSMHYKPAFDYSGRVIGALITIVDITEKKRRLQVLKDSEEKYRHLFQFSPLPQWIYELESFRIIDVNETAIKHYGYSREEFLSMTLMDLRPETEIHKLMAAHQNIHSINEVRNFGVFLHRKKNGDLIRVDVSAYPLNNNGKKNIMAIYNDVTEKYNAFQRLKESEAKLQASQKIAHIGYFELNNETQKLYWSDEIFNIWQLEPQKNQPDFDYIIKHIHPDDRDEVVKMMNSESRGEGDSESIHRIVLDDGTLKWIQLRWSRVMHDNKLVLVEGTVQDITESKLEFEKLLLNEVRYEYIMEATSDAIWDWDLISDKIHLGQGFQTLFGYKVGEENSGHEFWKKNIHHSDYQRVTGDLNEVAKRFESIWKIEYKLRKNNGDYAYVSDKGILIRNEDNEITRMIGVIQDISIEKNKELQKSLIADLSLTFSNLEASLEEILNEFLKRIISFGNFSISEIWLLNEDKSKLNLISKATISKELDVFYNKSTDFISFASGEGIPGKTFQTGTNQTFFDIDKNPEFMRHDAARIAGLVTAYGFPIKVKDEVIGVFVLGLRANEYDPFKIAALDENFLKVLSSEIERKIVHDALIDSEKQYSTLFHLNPEPMWVYDIETLKFLDVNKAAVDQYGYSREEFLSMTIKDIRPKEDIPLLKESIKWAKEHSEMGFDSKFRHLRKDGSILIVEIKNNIIRHQGRDVKLILAHNITERVNYIKAIEEQNLKLNEISWMHSHIVRAPVSKLMGLINLIKSTSPEDDLREELFGYVLESANELDAVIRKITEKAEEIHLKNPEFRTWRKE
jgi:PAS domain S-box-containing protein